MRSNRLGVILTLIVLVLILGPSGIPPTSGWARGSAQSWQRPRDQSLSTPMSFTIHYECSGNGCPYFVLAEGTINSETTAHFLEFMKAVKGAPTVFFNSPGGNLAAGIKLGRAIRDLGLDTFVGGPYVSFKGFDKKLKKLTEITETLADEGVCFSACAYAFLGGTSREIAKGGLLGVHQFYGGSADSGEAATQVTMTMLATYLDDMGINRRLLDIASLTPAREIEPIDLRLAQQLNVDNTNPPKGEWEIDVTRSGALFAYVVQKQPRKNAAVSLFLSRKNNYFVGTIRYRIAQKFRSNEEMVDAFTNNGSPPRLSRKSLRGNDSEVPLRAIQPWSAQADGSFTISFLVDTRPLNMIAQAQELVFNAMFPHAYEDIDPSITFSTNRLQRVIAALSK